MGGATRTGAETNTGALTMGGQGMTRMGGGPHRRPTGRGPNATGPAATTNGGGTITTGVGDPAPTPKPIPPAPPLMLIFQATRPAWAAPTVAAPRTRAVTNAFPFIGNSSCSCPRGWTGPDRCYSGTGPSRTDVVIQRMSPSPLPGEGPRGSSGRRWRARAFSALHLSAEEHSTAPSPIPNPSWDRPQRSRPHPPSRWAEAWTRNPW